MKPKQVITQLERLIFKLKDSENSGDYEQLIETLESAIWQTRKKFRLFNPDEQVLANRTDRLAEMCFALAGKIVSATESHPSDELREGHEITLQRIARRYHGLRYLLSAPATSAAAHTPPAEAAQGDGQPSTTSR